MEITVLGSLCVLDSQALGMQGRRSGYRAGVVDDKVR